MTGFVAGTLVHTERGLVPIQEIKVGDMVLSRPESGGCDAPIEYKRVTRTFKSPEKEIVVEIPFILDTDTRQVIRLKSIQNRPDYEMEQKSEKDIKPRDTMYLYCTQTHLFWTKEFGWLPADDINYKSEIENHFCTLVTFDGIKAKTFGSITPLAITDVEDIAMPPTFYEVDNHAVDFRKGKPIHLAGRKYLSSVGNEYLDTWDNQRVHLSEDIVFFPLELENEYYRFSLNNSRLRYSLDLDDYYCANVYNFEIEDYHTYFIGKAGIWVHC